MRPAARLLPIALLLGCGDGGEVGSDAQVSDASVTDASPVDASAIDAAPPPPPRLTADNVIFVTREGQTVVQFRPDDEGPGSCLIEWVHGCEIQDCNTEQVPAPLPHAGEITIVSAEDAHVLSPPGYSAFTPISWSPGDPITISATGADIPAFEVELRGPAPLVVREPDLASPVQVSRDEPLAFAWDGGSELTNVGVQCVESLARRVQVRCPVSAEAGQAEIPAAVLQDLPTCQTGLVFLLTEHRVEIEPGGMFLRVGVRGSLDYAAAGIE
jgi:hypothetical protein